MKLYLEPALASHRHGRYFISQLNAEPMDALPSDGMVLIHGKHFQGLEDQQQNRWLDWANRAGCALLLIPPFNAGLISKQLDWQIVFADAASSDDGQIPSAVAGEVVQRIEGADGDFDRNHGHQWTDFTINTRFNKQHFGSGVFVATCLPLWSISLLDLAEETIAWLSQLLALAGKPGENASGIHRDDPIELAPTDYTLLVCLSAWCLKSAEDVQLALDASETKLISLSEQALREGFTRLAALGYVDESGINELGESALAQSPYWIFAERLKEESQL